MPPGAELLAKITDLGTELPADVIETVCRELERHPALTPDAIDSAVRTVSQSATRARLRAALRMWLADQPNTPPAAFAWALRAAAATDGWHRARQHLELVWSGPAPHGTTLRRTDQALLELIRSAKRSITIVAFAAYRVPEIREALLDAVERGVAITFVAENPDISHGKVTIDPLAAMGSRLASKATVYVWPLDQRARDDRGNHGTLHAKCAIADDERLLVSSANFTEYAMELNMELGVLVEGEGLAAEVSRHVAALIREGVLGRADPLR